MKFLLSDIVYYSPHVHFNFIDSFEAIPSVLAEYIIGMQQKNRKILLEAPKGWKIRKTFGF